MKKQKGNLFVRDTVGDKIILTINSSRCACS